MTNSAYTATVRELEGVLPPRVVSRSLKDGLTLLGKTPDDVTAADLAQLLRGPVLKQLQAIMQPEKAQASVEGILERILNPGSPEREAAVSDAMRNTLGSLNDALKPFNMYFEWPEVQKLRAQIQLIETEMRAGEEAGALVREARQQIALLRQKLEDHLVIQAGELAELEHAAERLKSLGGPRVRRLGNLIEQIRAAQDARQLAPAEVERARNLTTDLRKLLESSIYATAVPGDIETEVEPAYKVEELPAEIVDRMRQLDLENEGHRLDQLDVQHTNILGLETSLRERLQALRRRVTDGESVSAEITALEMALKEAFNRARNGLTSELSVMAADTVALATPLGQTQLRQALQVANGILATTLPDPDDIRHLRDLYQLAREQVELVRRTVHEGVEMADAEQLAAIVVDSRQDLLNELYQLEQEARELPSSNMPEHEGLLDALRAARGMLAAEGDMLGTEPDLPDLNDLWLQLEDVRGSLSRRLDDFQPRLEAATQSLSRVERLNSEDVANVRRILGHLEKQQGTLAGLSLRLRVRLDDSLREAEDLLARLESEFEATRAIADRLVSAHILDDLLGGSAGETAAPPPREASTQPPPAVTADGEQLLSSGNATLDGILAGLAGERGVDQLVLVDNSRALAGTVNDAVPGLIRGLGELERDLVELGTGLGAGAPQLLTLELSGRILAVAWPSARHRVMIVVGVPEALSLVLHRVRQQLGSISGILDDPSFA